MVAHYDVYVCVVCSTVIVVDSIHVITERFVVSDIEILRNRILNVVDLHTGDRGSTVVKVLCYKSEGSWLDPSWCQWIFH